MVDNTIQEIKDRLNIAEIIGGYIQIKKAGAAFKANCPFHHEKTPSLQISPQKQIWHCFGCFPPGQKVKTPFGLHNIETIDENHFVYSGQGKIRRVLAIHKRSYAGKLVSIKVRKLGGVVTMTEDHNLTVLRPKTKYKKKNKQFYRQCREDLLKGKFGSAFQAANFHGNTLKITAGELQSNDFVFYPINITESNIEKINLKDYLTKTYTFGPRPPKLSFLQKISPELLKLVGYYIAEGSSHRAYIRFSLGNHEEDFANEIILLIQKLFRIKADIHRRSNNSNKTGLEITACHAYLANIFENLCGKGAPNKHIPYIFQELPVKKQKVLIKAIHKGDGHNYVASKSNKIHKSITSVSRILADQMVDVLLRNNLFPSLRIQKEKIDKKGVHHKEAYTIIWSEEAKSQHSFVISESSQTRNWLLPITGITKKKYKGSVHNLTIEKDHSYIATNFAVANCGEGGDVISFVQKFENLEFKESLKLLADRAGVRLPDYKPENRIQDNEKEILFRINDFASRFYHEVLLNDKKGVEALEYLKNRGLSVDTIKKWRIGYAPEDFHSLEQALAKKNVKNVDAIKAGVLTKNDRGQVYDRFRGRITFPIFDVQNRVLGFSARILPRLDDGKTGKYINSPQTLIYDKSKVLFGLNFAKNGIRKTGECLIVEGQMDCISAHQAGIDNAVASSGTALTDGQLDILSRFTKNLKYCFDADAAGLKATRRAIDAYLGREFLVKVVNLGGAKDPDELIRENKQAFLKLIEDAPLFLDYYLEKAFINFNAQSVEQKKNIAKDVLPLVKSLVDPVEQDHYIRKIAEKMSVNESAVRASLSSIKPIAVYKQATTQAKPKNKTGITVLGLEKEVLGGIIKFSEFKKLVQENFDTTDYENESISLEIQNILTGVSKGDSTVAKECVFMVESLMESSEGNGEAVLRQLIKSFYLLRVLSLKQKLVRLQAEIKFAEAQKDENTIKELNKKTSELTALRMECEKRFNF